MRLTLVPVLALLLVGCGLIDQVNGPDALTIQRFVASPDDVSSGASVTLTWDVKGADAVQIDNGVGTVPAKGTKSFPAYRTATYTLTAKAGTSSATASVQVNVKGTAGDPFVFFPSPTPSPEPSASPSPSPNPSPTPSPEPSPSPGVSSVCGTSVTQAGTCDIEIDHPVALPDGQCVELAKLTTELKCPIAEGKSTTIKFDIAANVSRAIRWRQEPDSKDQLTPDEGKLQVSGTTSVKVDDKVVGNGLHMQVVNDDGEVYLSFVLKHQ